MNLQLKHYYKSRNKLFVFTIFFLIATFESLSAQIVINPKIGGNFATFLDDLNGFEADQSVGFSLGADFRIGNSRLYAKPGAHYIQIGNDFKVSSQDVSANINLLAVPLNVGVSLKEQDATLNFHLFGGLTPTFKLGIDEAPDAQFRDEEVDDFYLAWNLGFGVDLSIFTFEFDYSYGFSDFVKNTDSKLRIASIKAGVKF